MASLAARLDYLERIGDDLLELEYQARRLRLLLTLRAGFKPDQPRNPGGSGDISGEWSGGAGSSGNESPPRGIGDNSGPAGVDQILDIPEKSPEEVDSVRERIAIAILRFLAQGAGLLVGGILVVLTGSTAADDTADAVYRQTGKRPSELLPG